MRSAIVAIACVVAGLAASAQAPVRDRVSIAVAGSASIAGVVVVDDVQKEPLRHAAMTLTRAGIEDIRKTTTDERGRYVFAELPVGIYTLSAAKGGYIGKSLGAPRPGMPGSTIPLTDGQAFTAAPIALIRGGVITGRIVDRSGRPFEGLQVHATQWVVVNGERRRRNLTGAGGSDFTDAHGEFRIFGLLAGEYLVFTVPPTGQPRRDVTPAELAWSGRQTSAAPPPQAQAWSYAPTLFPGVAELSAATPITLGSGEERRGVDMHLQYATVSSVSGVVTALDGRPAQGVLVNQAAQSQNAIFPIGGFGTRTGADGSFVILGVAPGQIVLMARTAPAPARGVPPAVAAGQAQEMAWATAEITVAGQDVRNVNLRLQPALNVSGRVVVEADARARMPANDQGSIRVDVVPVDPDSVRPTVNATVGADGTFTSSGLVPGKVRMTVTLTAAQFAAGLVVRSAMAGSIDLLDQPIDVRPNQGLSDVVVTVSGRSTQLSGQLVDSAGNPAPRFYVFVYPVDRTFWLQANRRLRSARADVTGRYSIAGLPPGDYYLCAMSDLDSALQNDPTYLEQLLPGSIRVTLADGEQRAQDLKVGG